MSTSGLVERPKIHRVGIRAHDLGCHAPLDLAQRVAAVGAESVQLALSKAIKGVEMKPVPLFSAMAREIGAAFHAHHITVDVLGCYVNPIHPDPVIRGNLLGWFNAHQQHAREFGSNMIALESGSLSADYSPNPGNGSEIAFSSLLSSMAKLLEAAESTGTLVGIEAVASHVVSSPSKMKRLLNELASPHLRVVLDPVNLLTTSNHLSQRAIMEQCFEGFGSFIDVIHVKDFLIHEDRLIAVPAGEGNLDYDYLFSCAARCNQEISVILEESGPETADRCIRFIRKKCQNISR